MFDWIVPEDPALSPVQAALAQGHVEDAVRKLRGIIPELSESRRFGGAMALLGRATEGMVAGEASQALLDASEDPDDVDALYAAGFQLYEVGLHDLGAEVLMRANRIEPGSARIVTEASACLEAALRYRESAALLDDSGLVGREEMVTYLSGFCRLMAGDLEIAQQRLIELGEPEDETARFVRDQLAAMVARARALSAHTPLDARALSAWHMALNGAVLLHESPHGHPDPMNGRYAYVSDSAELMREGVDRLLALLADRVPARVVHAPDRASHILGLAVAKAAGKPLIPWTEALGSPEDALVVAWDLDAVGDVAFAQALQDHAPGQVLFAHASSWVDPFLYSPDVTTFLHQAVAHPWTGGALTRLSDGSVGPIAPDARADEALAAEVLAATVRDGSVTPATLPRLLVEAVKDLPPDARPGLLRSEGARARQRAGSPVASSRFA